MSGPRHFITGTELRRDELHRADRRARRELRRARDGSDALRRRSVALLFEQALHAHPVSFEVGIAAARRHAVAAARRRAAAGAGGVPRDTALVLSRYVDAIVARLGDHALIEELAALREVPVVNALTPLHHPCQALADLLTLRERFGALEGLRLAYVGDGNNVCHSLMLLGAPPASRSRSRRPPELRPDAEIVRAGGRPGQLGRRPGRRRPRALTRSTRTSG